MIFKWCCKTYSESVSNVAYGASAQLLSSFLEYEVLVVVNDRYDFESSIKAADSKRRTEDSAHIHKIEIVGNRNVTVISKLPREFEQ